MAAIGTGSGSGVLSAALTTTTRRTPEWCAIGEAYENAARTPLHHPLPSLSGRQLGQELPNREHLNIAESCATVHHAHEDLALQALRAIGERFQAREHVR